jgi:preprotein translocase subunit SecA
MRKRVLEYDDVMNQQREVIYEIRDRILEGDDMSQTARQQISDAIERLANQYLVGDYVEDWDIGGLFTQLEQMYPIGLTEDDPALDPNKISREVLIEELKDDVVKAYDEREEELGAELMRALERYILLEIIDERWREHLHDMDYLREGIHLRGFAQIEPIIAYKNDGFDMFRTLINSIWEEFARFIFHVEVEVEGQNGDGAQAAPQPGGGWAVGGGSSSSSTGSYNYQGGQGAVQPSALAAAAAGGVPEGIQGAAADAVGEVYEEVQVEQRVLDEHETIGRNDPCWCGSGKKFKKCHGA